MDDFRIKTSWRNHPKRVKLRKRLGDAGVVAVLDLWAFCAEEHTDGDLTTLSNEDIAIAARWDGDPDTFVGELLDLRILEATGEGLIVHDWAEHNPFVASHVDRSEQARNAANTRWSKAKKKHAPSNAHAHANHANASEAYASSNAPSPIPSPSPLPTPHACIPPAAVSPEAPDDPDPEPKSPAGDLGDISRRIASGVRLVSVEDAERLDRSLTSRGEDHLGLSQIEEILCSPPSTAGSIPHGKRWPVMGGHVLRDLMPVKPGELPIIADAVRRTEDACEQPNWVWLKKAIRGGREQRLKAPCPVARVHSTAERGATNGCRETYRATRERAFVTDINAGMASVWAKIGAS